MIGASQKTHKTHKGKRRDVPGGGSKEFYNKQKRSILKDGSNVAR
jgi:hypothetical protein